MAKEQEKQKQENTASVEAQARAYAEIEKTSKSQVEATRKQLVLQEFIRKGYVKTKQEILALSKELAKGELTQERLVKISKRYGESVEAVRDVYDDINKLSDEQLKNRREQDKIWQKYRKDYEKHHDLLEEADEWGEDELDRRKEINKLYKKQLGTFDTLNGRIQTMSSLNRGNLTTLGDSLGIVNDQIQSTKTLQEHVKETGAQSLISFNVDEFDKELGNLKGSLNDVLSGGGNEFGDVFDISASLDTLRGNLDGMKDVVAKSKKDIQTQMRSFLGNTELISSVDIQLEGVDDVSTKTDLIRKYMLDLSKRARGVTDGLELAEDQFAEVQRALKDSGDESIVYANALGVAHAQVTEMGNQLDTTESKLDLFDNMSSAVGEVIDEVRYMVEGLLPNWASELLGVEKIFGGLNKAATNALTAASEQYTTMMSNGNAANAATSAMSTFFSTFSSGMNSVLSTINPMFLAMAGIALVVGGLVSLYNGLEKSVEEYSTELGISRDTAFELYNNVLDTTTQTENLLAIEEDVLEVMKAHKEQYGTILDLNKEGAKEAVLFAQALGSQYGVSTEEAYKLSSTFKQLGADTAMADNLSLYVAEAANLSGISFKTITNDLAEASETVLLHFNGMPEKAAKAAVEIRRMGMSMKQVGAVMDKALDIGGFMNDMTELNLMTGGSANLQTFFDMRFSGASPDEMAEEIAKQYDNMVASGQANEFTMRKFAEATGMSVEELEKGRIIREDLADLTEEQRATLEKHMGNLSKEELSNAKTAMLAAERLQTQDKMNASMQKLKGILMKAVMPIAEAFGELLEGLMPVLDIIGGLFRVIGGIIKGIIAPIFKGILMPFKFLANILGSIINFFSSIFGGVSDTAEKSSFLHGIFKAIEVVLIGIGAVIGGSMILGNLGKITNVVSAFGGKLSSIAGGGVKLLGSSFNKLGSIIGNNLKASGEQIKGIFGVDVFSTLKNKGQEAFSFIKGGFSKLKGSVGNLDGVVSGVGEKMSKVFGSITNKFKSMNLSGIFKQQGEGGVKNLLGSFKDVGKNLMGKFKSLNLSGIFKQQGQGGVKNFTDKFKSLNLSGIFKKKGEEGASSFLSSFKDIGKNLMDKFKSIKMPKLGGAGKDLAKGVSQDAAGRWRDAKGRFAKAPAIPDKAVGGIDKATDVGKNADPKMGKAISEFLKGLTDGLKYMGDNFGKVVKGGLALGIAGLALAGGFAIALRIAKGVDPAAMIAFSISLGLLGGAMYLMGKRYTDVIKGSIALAAMGVGLLAAGAAFSLIRGVDSQSIITFSVALAALAVGAAVLGQFVGLIIPGAIALAALGLALIPAAFAFSLIGTLDANSIIIFGVALGAFALAAAGLGLLAGPIIAGSIALLALGVALIPAAFAFSLIGTLDPTSIVAFSGALIVLAGAAAGFGLLSPLIVAGSFALGVLGLALIPAAAAFSLLGGVDATSILAFSSSIIMLATGVAMFGLMTPLILLGAVTLTVLSGALNLAASAFSMLSGVDSGMIQEFSNTLISLAYGVAQFGLLTPLILAGAVTLGVLGAALIPAAFAFSLLSGVDSDSMLTFSNVLMQLAMGAAMFGILGALIIAGSVALGVLGLALIPAAFSFSLIAGLDAESLSAFADTLIRLANGAAAFGLFAPLIIMGSVALGVLGAALVPAAFAFSLIGSLDAGSVMIFASTLLFLATTMAGLGVLAGAIALGAVAIGILGTALVPAAFAFSLIGTLDAGSVLLFAGTLLFLANAVAAFGILSGLIIAGSIALLALGIALIPAAKAFSMISGIDGESIAVFSVALISLASAAASFGIVSPLIVMGSIALLALGLALIPAAKAFNMISGVDGESLKAFADTLIRLANGAAMFGILSPLIINGSLALAILGFSLLPAVKAFSMLAGLDAGAITAFADTLIRLANGAAIFGIMSPLIIMGSIALAFLGRALMPTVQAFNLLSGLDAGAITAFADTLISLAYSASVFGSMAGLIIAGSLAISILGVALRPVAKSFAMIGDVDPTSMTAFAESVVIIADAAAYAGGRVMAMIKGSLALAAMGKGIRPAAKAFALLGDVDPAAISAFGQSVVDLADYALSLAGSKGEMEEGSGALRSLGFTIMMFGLSVMIAQPAIKTVTKLFESLNGLDGQKLTSASEGIRSVADALAYFNERASSGGGGLGAIFSSMFSSDPMEKFREMADLVDPLMRFAEALERIVAASGGAIGVGESIDGKQLETDTRKMERTGEVARESIAESSMVSAEVTGTAAAPQTPQRTVTSAGGGGGNMNGVIAALEAVASRPIIVQLGEIELKKINRKMRALNNNVS